MSLETIISQYVDPWTGLDLAKSKSLKQVDVKDEQLSVVIELHYPHAGVRETIAEDVARFLRKKTGFTNIKVTVETAILSHVIASGLKAHPNIKNIIAVASGKGGVGKSTTSVNLALALQAEGARAGILDADIYGPSQPFMLGAGGYQGAAEEGKLTPVIRHGIQSMSIGYLVDITNAVAWRGPMVSGALQQLLTQTQWEPLDYLIIDLPPGTGDIHLTLAQKVPVTAAIIVTTPQDISLIDARRAVSLFQKVNVPVLGIVENMSTHVCSKCGHEEAIFGQQGGKQMAQEYDLPLLAELPLDRRIREDVDNGVPTVVAEAAGHLSQLYRDLALRVAAKLSLQSKDYARRFASIGVTEN